MGPMSVVAHGGEDDLEVEGVTGQAEEVCHTHNIIIPRFWCALWICVDVFFYEHSRAVQRGAMVELDNVFGWTDHAFSHGIG